MYTLRPERDRLTVGRGYREHWRPAHEAAARRVGVEMRDVTPAQVLVHTRGAGDPEVLVDGSPIDPRDAFFHTKVLTWPPYARDVWGMLTLVELLEAAGYYVTVPAAANVVNNDKLVTTLALDSLAPHLPSLRVLTRQFDRLRPEALADASLDFPVVVKPDSWGAGFGVQVATTQQALDAALQLAGAAELGMLIQPYVPGAVDVRVCCIEGRPVAALERVPRADATVANYHRGGTQRRIAVPAQLAEPSCAIASHVGTAFLCVDYLLADKTWWLSEIEVDGGVQPYDDLHDARLRAHLDRFAARTPEEAR